EVGRRAEAERLVGLGRDQVIGVRGRRAVHVRVDVDEPRQQGHVPQVVRAVGRRHVARQLPAGHHRADAPRLGQDGVVGEPRRHLGIRHAAGGEHGAMRHGTSPDVGLGARDPRRRSPGYVGRAPPRKGRTRRARSRGTPRPGAWYTGPRSALVRAGRGAGIDDMSTGIQVACLLPARNCAEDLPGWFESVARVADAVVALDDGSTDATRTILAGHPLVRRLLVNPVRASYEGWDDGANRARLLDAAAGLAPAWIISLDADERLPADDAAPLRRVLRTAADRSGAYLLTRYRMVGDVDHFDAGRPFLFGRLFAFEPGQRMPRERLHFVPIPTSIPSTRWVRTTLRIQHLAGLTPERQRARVAKYREADPGRRFGRRYGPLLRPPADVQRWPPRPPELPVVTNRDAPAEAGGAGEPGAPLLSAIVIARDDEARIARAVASVVRQRVPAPFEVI